MYDDVPTEKILEMRRKGMSDNQIRDALEQEKFGNNQISEGFTQASVKSGVESKNYSDQGYMGYGGNSFSQGAPQRRMPYDQNQQNYPSQEQYSQENYSQPQYGQDEYSMEPGMQESAMSTGSALPPAPSAPEAPGSPVEQDYEDYGDYEEEEDIAPKMKLSSTPQISTEDIENKISQIAESIIDERWQEVAGVIGKLNVWKAKTDDDLLSVKQEILRMSKRFENLERAVLGKVSDYNKSVLDMGSEIKALEKVLEKIMQPLSTNVKELEKLAKRVKKK